MAMPGLEPPQLEAVEAEVPPKGRLGGKRVERFQSSDTYISNIDVRSQFDDLQQIMI